MSWFRSAGPQHARPAAAERVVGVHPPERAIGPRAAGVPDFAAGADRAAAPAGTPWPVDAVGDRRLLIDMVIYAFDRARTPAVQQRLAAGLAEIGVQVIRPDGGAFDPGAQEAGGVLPTADPALHNVIAETESAGFRDGERIVREPVVVVYRLTDRG